MGFITFFTFSNHATRFFKIIFDMNYVLLGSIFLALFIALLLVRKYLISKAEASNQKRQLS